MEGTREVVNIKPTSIVYTPDTIPNKISDAIGKVDQVNNDGTSEASTASSPVEMDIIIPKGLEAITSPNTGVAADIFIDRVNKRVYRKINFDRYSTDADFNIRDFYHKVELSKQDTTRLTPRVYSYDPKTYTIEMELVEGQALIHNVEITQETAEHFLQKLRNFHALGLYHGDMFSLQHWFLTPSKELRLIDPIYMPTDISDSGNTVQEIQATDIDIAFTRLRKFGIKFAEFKPKEK